MTDKDLKSISPITHNREDLMLFFIDFGSGIPAD